MSVVNDPSPLAPRPSPPRIVPKRILVIRLDRIGDVVLSTPVLQQLRETYPQAFIGMMVRPACRDLVDGNPHVNEVLVYDKHGPHHSLLTTVRFARGLLRRFRFDTAVVLHPTNRSHWIPWLAGIPRRIGYNRKCAWLLTHRVPHRKHEGTKHEAEYALDMLRVLGIEPATPTPMVPIHPAADHRVRQLLRQQGVDDSAILVAMHPFASDSSRCWPAERFAQLADRLTHEHRAHIVVVAGPEDAPQARTVVRLMRQRAVNFAGALSIGELAALLARCRLLVSNDSGPVHIAAAVGTPVVAIFGRNQPGINAARWRPLGSGHVVLDKPAGPRSNYIADWSVDDVYQAATRLLQFPSGGIQASLR